MTTASFSFLDNVQFAPRMEPLTDMDSTFAKSDVMMQEIRKREPARRALSQALDKKFKEDVHFACSDQPKRVVAVAPAVLPYVSMTLANMIEAVGTGNPATSPFPIDNLEYDVFAFIVRVANKTQAQLKALPKRLSDEAFDNLPEEEKDAIHKAYESALIQVVQTIHTMQTTFFKEALQKAKTRFTNMSVEAFAKVVIKQEQGRVEEQLASLRTKITTQTRGELTRKAQRANSQLSWQKAQEAIKEELTDLVETRYQAKKTALQAKLKNEFEPKLRTFLVHPEKRKVFYVGALRRYWLELFYTILQTVGAYYENTIVLFAFGLKMVSIIRNKSDEEIRKALDIVNDFTPEEYEKLKKENQWLNKP